MWKWAVVVNAVLLGALYQLIMWRFRSLPPAIPWSSGSVVALMVKASFALAALNVGVAVCIAMMRRDRSSGGETAIAMASAAACFAVALGMFFFLVLLPLASQY